MENATVMTAKQLAAQLRYQQQYRGAVATLCHLAARNKVKELLRASGRKVHHFTAREISEMASDYLLAHREELIENAKVRATQILAKRR
jgi:hypothetical protein